MQYSRWGLQSANQRGRITSFVLLDCRCPLPSDIRVATASMIIHVSEQYSFCSGEQYALRVCEWEISGRSEVSTGIFVLENTVTVSSRSLEEKTKSE